MTPIQASRLKGPTKEKSNFLESILPHGSLARRLVIGYGSPVLILIILGLMVDMIVMPIMTRHGSEFPLPEFSGQRLFEANVSLRELDLSYEISSEEFSAEHEEGTIIGQFPPAGTQVKPERKIRFVVSQGISQRN